LDKKQVLDQRTWCWELEIKKKHISSLYCLDILRWLFDSAAVLTRLQIPYFAFVV
jgi:hypothetical protein